jgi:hypothetical protein
MSPSDGHHQELHHQELQAPDYPLWHRLPARLAVPHGSKNRYCVAVFRSPLEHVETV